MDEVERDRHMTLRLDPKDRNLHPGLLGAGRRRQSIQLCRTYVESYGIGFLQTVAE